MADHHIGSQDHFARHGGVHFRANVSEQELNRFVAFLPESRRSNMAQVMKELESAGMITILNDGIWADGEGKIGGSDEC
ncbi:hypothetical protein H1164_03140 [Thermoactinomyces daqus]|uniref:Uncharacterized protein n=1 Tax=Thermoactinomyces daqus TaxID=1329516 RepID=A0A7W1X8G2_9BACL|nr:hypothetical protein [Thermoactinomyces daqus]MBA4541897.1 hypothetical protein [Thermoactinomyces daqus]